MGFTRRETAILLIVDLCMLVASFWAALVLRNLALPSFSYLKINFVPFAPVFLVSLAVFYIAGLYEKQTKLVRRVMGIRILGAQIANVIVAAVIFFVLPLRIAPKTILALYLVISVLAESAWRFWYTARVRTVASPSAILVGTGLAVTEVFDEVNDNGRYLFSFKEHVDTKLLTPGLVLERVAAALHGGVRVVVIDTRDPAVLKDLAALYRFMTSGVSFLEFSSFYEEIFDRVPLAHVDHAWLLECLPKRSGFYDLTKRAFDLVLALVGLVLALPFIVLAALLLYVEGGSAFILHERIGKGEKRFNIVKLRSMLFNDHGDPELQKKNRVTRLGGFLRKTRIDELPQLWNVFRGDVSFIGPRPELPSIAAVYEREIPYYRTRHLITPGLSGWAQIRDYDAPRGGADVERTKRKLSYDLYYLKHRSFGLDLVIVLKTLRALFAFSGT